MRIVRTVFGLIYGAAIGALLYFLIKKIFGEMWTVEAGGPWPILVSPFAVPTLAGLLSGAVDESESGWGYKLFTLIAAVSHVIVSFVYMLIGVCFDFSDKVMVCGVVVIGVIMILGAIGYTKEYAY